MAFESPFSPSSPQSRYFFISPKLYPFSRHAFLPSFLPSFLARRQTMIFFEARHARTFCPPHAQHARDSFCSCPDLDALCLFPRTLEATQKNDKSLGGAISFKLKMKWLRCSHLELHFR